MERTTTAPPVGRSPQRRMKRLRRERDAWKRGALGLLAFAVAGNAVLFALHSAETEQLQNELAYAQEVQRQAVGALGAATLNRDRALDELTSMAVKTAGERQARIEQAKAYEAVGKYEYIGECTITHYCACVECCGKWADGKTSTGLTLTTGMCAVDPDVIPLGSTVMVDGKRYLAADAGVTGYHVDIAVAGHQEALERGVGKEPVWIILEKEE